MAFEVEVEFEFEFASDDVGESICEEGLSEVVLSERKSKSSPKTLDLLSVLVSITVSFFVGIGAEKMSKFGSDGIDSFDIDSNSPNPVSIIDL